MCLLRRSWSSSQCRTALLGKIVDCEDRRNWADWYAGAAVYALDRVNEELVDLFEPRAAVFVLCVLAAAWSLMKVAEAHELTLQLQCAHYDSIPRRSRAAGKAAPSVHSGAP